MTFIHSIAIGKGFVNQEDVDSLGTSTGSYDTPSLKMSKYYSFDNPNTGLSSASTVPGDVSEKDVKEFDRVLMEDRDGITPGGGFYIPEGRGTIGPDIPMAVVRVLIHYHQRQNNMVFKMIQLFTL